MPDRTTVFQEFFQVYLPEYGQPQVCLAPPFLKIEANNTYLLHLGTGNIHLEPTGKFFRLSPQDYSHLEVYYPHDDEQTYAKELLQKVHFLLLNAV